jgi:hypothetical protein
MHLGPTSRPILGGAPPFLESPGAGRVVDNVDEDERPATGLDNRIVWEAGERSAM